MKWTKTLDNFSGGAPGEADVKKEGLGGGADGRPRDAGLVFRRERQQVRIRVDIHLVGPGIKASKMIIFKGVLVIK